jgi:uncharacterized protein YbbC (DUF1343 family)
MYTQQGQQQLQANTTLAEQWQTQMNLALLQRGTSMRFGFGGVRIHIHPRNTTDLTALDVLLLAEINRLSGGKVVSRMNGSKLNLFNKVYGSESLYSDLRRGVPSTSIIARWQGWNQSFRSQRQRFLLYP